MCGFLEARGGTLAFDGPLDHCCCWWPNVPKPQLRITASHLGKVWLASLHTGICRHQGKERKEREERRKDGKWQDLKGGRGVVPSIECHHMFPTPLGSLWAIGPLYSTCSCFTKEPEEKQEAQARVSKPERPGAP